MQISVHYRTKLTISISSSESWSNEVAVAADDGEWHTFTVIGSRKDSQPCLDLYFDGLVIATVDSSVISGVQPLQILVGPIAGTMRDVALWDVPLNEEQVCHVS